MQLRTEQQLEQRSCSPISHGRNERVLTNNVVESRRDSNHAAKETSQMSVYHREPPREGAQMQLVVLLDDVSVNQRC